MCSKPFLLALDSAKKFTIFIDTRNFVQQVFDRDSDMVKEHKSIINLITAILWSTIAN